MFGKKHPSAAIVKPVPILVNLPSGPQVRSLRSTKEKETCEYYLIAQDQIQEIKGKQFYRTSELERLTRINRTSDGNTYDYWTFWTDGKETLRISPKYGHLFSLNDETNEITFHMGFFKLLGDIKQVLLRIQAPAIWHRERARVDPEITMEWGPEWK